MREESNHDQDLRKIYDLSTKHCIVRRKLSLGVYCILGEKQGTIPLRISEPTIIRSHSVLYMGTKIGINFVTGHHILIRQDCTIGKSVCIGASTVTEHNVDICDTVRIHSQAFIPEYSIIENDAWIGPRVTCTNALYPRSIGVKKFKGASY